MDQLVNDARVRSHPAIEELHTTDEDAGKIVGGPHAAPAGDPDILGSRPRSRPGRRFRGVVMVGAVLIVILAVWSGNRYLVPHVEGQFVVKPIDLAIELTGPGTLDATRTSLISSRFQGVIAAMHVDINDQVRRGDVIAELATEDLKSEFAAAQASAEAARKAVDLSIADRMHSDATLENARQNFERQNALLRKSITSKESYDAAASALRQAEADLTRSQAAIEQAKAQLASAEATAEIQRVKLDEGTIRAPFDGVVVSRDHYVGDTIAPGTEIVRLVDTASIILSARLDESAIYRLSPGQTAVIRFTGAGKEASVTATVFRIGRQVDTETREFSVDLRPEALPPNWALGQRAIATIELGSRKNVLAVPVGAIERRQGAPGVWIVDRGRAHWNAITLGETGRQLVEVTRGLEPGDIIMNEPRDVYSGMKVADGGGA
jgi:HlyD family secretion protein